jgi:hypothetical protein
VHSVLISLLKSLVSLSYKDLRLISYLIYVLIFPTVPLFGLLLLVCLTTGLSCFDDQ